MEMEMEIYSQMEMEYMEMEWKYILKWKYIPFLSIKTNVNHSLMALMMFYHMLESLVVFERGP